MFCKYECKQALRMGNLVISLQKDYIKELEQNVEDLQKSLDAAKKNKVKVRKVKVKIYGRGPVDKNLHRHVRQAED